MPIPNFKDHEAGQRFTNFKDHKQFSLSRLDGQHTVQLVVNLTTLLQTSAVNSPVFLSTRLRLIEQLVVTDLIRATKIFN